MTLMDVINEWRNNREAKARQSDIEEEKPPREIRDRYLESLERENQYQDNQDRKEMLKKKIAEYKKNKMKELLYGIKDKREKRDSYLGQHVLKQKVNVLKDSSNILKQNSIMRQRSILSRNSLLNNRKEEFKRKVRVM